MSKNNPPLITQRLARLGVVASAIIIVLLPFHAFFTTWLGTSLGNYDLVRSWKEALLLVGLVMTIAIVLTDHTKRWRQLLNQTLMKWVLAFAVVALVWSVATLLYGRVSQEALAYGLMIQLRFMCFFGLAALFSLYDDLLYRHWQKLLFGPAILVVSFGLLQITVLPIDFLRQFGYGPDTIPAFQTIDNKLEFRRIQSTLRGANPYGAYLVIIITALVVRLWKQRRDYMSWLLLVGAVINLYFTYSRSAWIGLAISLAVTGALLSGKKMRRLLLLGMVAMSLVLATTVWVLRDNDYVQNTLFHSDETSGSVQSSNEQRGEAVTDSLAEVAQAPLGGGVGSAGPASFRNSPDEPRIAENYYVQTGQEMGWAGFFVLVSVMVVAGRWLYRHYLRYSSLLSLVLFASLTGITFINLVSHAWADDTLSLLWWGMFGGLLVHGILNKEQTHATKTKTRNKTNS